MMGDSALVRCLNGTTGLRCRSARRVLAVACCCLTVAVLTGCVARRPTAVRFSGPPDRAASSQPRRTAVRVLQMNLCDSGIAACYTGGRSVLMAASIIRAQRPDIVTLNEVCRQDVSVLNEAMAAAHRGVRIAAAFDPAVDRRTEAPFRCRSGQELGDGVLAVPPPAVAHRTVAGIYPTQDVSDPEERVWVCIEFATRYSACSTHLASTSVAIALAQCRYFVRFEVPVLRAQASNAPLVFGADLNLPVGNSPGPKACLAHGDERADDGARQDVVASPGVVVGARRVIDMLGTTDHPGLSVDVMLSADATPRRRDAPEAQPR